MALKKTVQVKRATKTSDSAGGFTDTWVTKYTIEGFLVQPSGRRQIYHQKLEVHSSHVFYTKYFADISEKDIIVYGTRSFEIVYVANPGEMNKYLALHLEEDV